MCPCFSIHILQQKQINFSNTMLFVMTITVLNLRLRICSWKRHTCILKIYFKKTATVHVEREWHNFRKRIFFRELNVWHINVFGLIRFNSYMVVQICCRFYKYSAYLVFCRTCFSKEVCRGLSHFLIQKSVLVLVCLPKNICSKGWPMFLSNVYHVAKALISEAGHIRQFFQLQNIQLIEFTGQYSI